MQNLVNELPDFYEVKEGLSLATKMPKEGFFDKPTKVILDGVLLRVNMNGVGAYKSLDCDYEIKSKNNHTIIDAVNQDTGISYSKNLDEQIFISIIIHKDLLKQILPIDSKSEEIFNFFESKQNIKNLHFDKIKQKTKFLAQSILKNTYNSKLRHLYLESAVLEILYLEFDNFLSQTSQGNEKLKLNNADIEAIYHAKEILENNLANPPSISQLSKLVALNEFKLKAGFKKILNETPHNLSVISRLQEAKNLLETSDLSISEIAREVGYNYPQSFSNAFFKCFKIRPMDLMKKRKYYY